MSRRKRMVKDLINLSIGEGLISVAYIIVYFANVRQFDLKVLWYDYVVFFLLIFILWQGSFFWWYLSRRFRGKVNHIRRYRTIYYVLRWIDRILIGSCLILNFMFDRYFYMNLGILIVVLIEYFNYFYIRLSYPLNEFFKRLIRFQFHRSRLSKEFF